MNARQEKFAQEWLKDFNATQAAIRAGYSKRTAYSQGQRLLKNVEVDQLIQQLKQQAYQRNQMHIDEAISILSDMARFDLLDLYKKDGSFKDVHDIPKHARMAIKGLETTDLLDHKEKTFNGTLNKVKTTDRKAILEILLRYRGAFKLDNEQQKPESHTVEELEAELKLIDGKIKLMNELRGSATKKDRDKE